MTGEKMIAPRTNFDRIDSAMTTVFIIIIGEDWPAVMYDYVRVYRNYGGELYGDMASMVFMFCFAVGNFMLLSLFTAILLSNFEEDKVDEVEEDLDGSRRSIKRQSTLSAFTSD